MTKVFIVEDDFILMENMIALCQKIGYDIVGTCVDGDMAYNAIVEAQPEVVFLDIALPGKCNGIIIGEKINATTDIPHIFVTSFKDNETIDEAVHSKPAAYLTKPVDETLVKAAVELALSKKNQVNEAKVESQNEQDMFVRVGDNLKKITFEEIKWVERADSNYCYLVMGKKFKVAVRESLTKIVELLPKDIFIQTHRGFIVNKNQIESINVREMYIQVDDAVIPLGRTFKDAVLSRIKLLK